MEFALVLPLLLVMFLGIADFGRVFHAGIVIEAGARNAAEIVAEEYRRMLVADALPDAALYQSLHDLGGATVCDEARTLPDTTYDPLTRACHVNDGNAATHDWMPIVLVCIHDGTDPLCGTAAFGAAIPNPECSALLSPMSSAMEGGAEDSRYVEVRVCYRFSTLISGPFTVLGEVWLQKDRAFTVADYTVPVPSIPAPASPPPPTDLPSEEPSPSPTPSSTPTATPEASTSATTTPAPSSEPTPEPTLTPTPTPTPTPEPAP